MKLNCTLFLACLYSVEDGPSLDFIIKTYIKPLWTQLCVDAVDSFIAHSRFISHAIGDLHLIYNSCRFTRISDENFGAVEIPYDVDDLYSKIL